MAYLSCSQESADAGAIEAAGTERFLASQQVVVFAQPGAWVQVDAIDD